MINLPIVDSAASQLYFPGCSPSDRETAEIDRAREIIRGLYRDRHEAFWVNYSGGKDSTLLLQLVSEVILQERERERERASKPVIVCYSNTPYDYPPKIAYINRQLDRLKTVAAFNEIVVSSAPPEESILSRICGTGYPAPNFTYRYCTKAHKVVPARIIQRKRSDQFGGLITLTGTRKDESTKRLRRLTASGAPREMVTFRKKPTPIYESSPIADVSTSAVWSYLTRIGSFAWGGDVDELSCLYKDITKNRDGCWICTVAAESSFVDGDTPRGRIRRYLREMSADRRERCVTRTDKQRERLAQGYASGLFTIAARKKIFEFIKAVEAESGEQFITPEEERFIRDKWQEEMTDDRDIRDHGRRD